MPNDWQRWLVAVATTIFIILTVAVLYWARSILLPIAVAIFLTFVLSPLVAWLQHRGCGRTTSVVIVSVALLAAVGGIGFVVTHEMIGILTTLPDRQEGVVRKLKALRDWLSGPGETRLGKFFDDVQEVIFPKQHAPEQRVVVVSSSPATSWLSQYISPTAEILGQLALTIILTIYMLISREDLRNRMIRLLGSGRVTTTTKAVDEASRRVSKFLLTQLAVNVGFGILIGVGLLALGVKYVLLWGFLAGLLRYVPYFGTWIGLLPPVLFSFATAPPWLGGWGQPLFAFLLYATCELVIANGIEPWLYGASMGLSSVAQLVAAAFWAYVWGPIGLILSGPLTACLLVLGRYVHGAGFLEVLLGDEPALSPPVAFYQRLAANDQDEAATVALEVARASGTEAALETVVVPALGMIRRDRDLGELDATTFQAAVRAAREVAAEIAELQQAPVTPPRSSRVRVLACPSRDEAEHVAAEILESILDPTKWEVMVVGPDMLASELVETVDTFRPAAIVVVAIPPGGVSHCRYMVIRLRARFPELRILIGRWGPEARTEDESMGVKRVDAEDPSLLATLNRLTALYPVLLTGEEKRDSDAGTPNPKNDGATEKPKEALAREVQQ